jgi:tetratricopeptide (TPR) repeat protein
MAMRLIVVMLLVAVRMELPGCGPFLPRALFALEHEPEKPAEEFARGQLGVLQPGYTRDYLIVAYRHLAGIGLTEAERTALYPPPTPQAEGQSRRNPWLEARNRVPGVKPVTDIDAYRVVKTPGAYDSYLNCHDDAFQTAAATLQRISQRGPAATAEWVAAQDQVFTNCSAGPVIPASTPDPERAYQVAAAKFYVGQFDAAREDFERIAADTSSPWHSLAPYLAARCRLRKGEYAEAVRLFERVLADPAAARWHVSARGLIEFTRAKADPAGRTRELAAAVLQPGSPTLARDAFEYHFLLDYRTSPPREDDITDWILTLQQGAAPHAVERWRATRTAAWLAAALVKVSTGDAAVPELLAAAREVKPDAPAFATVRFHSARLSPGEGARSTAEEALRAQLPASARNLFRAVLLREARTFEEFLRYAPRTAVGAEYDVQQAKPDSSAYLDADAATMLTRGVPLARLQEAAASPLLPEAARRQLADVVFVRGVLLAGRPATWDEVYRLLKTPGLKPYVDTGFGRYEKDPAKIENFRDNWWCTVHPVEDAEDDSGSFFFRMRAALPEPLKALYPSGQMSAVFLPEAERAQAAAEWKQLAALPTAPTWLGREVMRLAEATPAEPRLPEALHLVVRAGRYGCADATTREYSRRAFQLLHRRFPGSEWARKTPYYY